MVPNEEYFFFHISSKKSSVKTCSERFINHVLKSLDDMKAMFLEVEEKQKQANKKED
jgi:hypothetical protein